MFKKYIFLIFSVAAIAAFLGCHAGGSSPLAPNNGETVVSPETRTVGTNGRFTDITFPSGAVIKCPNDKTFQEGVKVTATEEKVPVITDNSGKFSYIYVYNISAVMPSENSLTADVPVNTIEKPISVTIPNDSTTGTCYIGTRASDKDPWRYSLANDGLNSNARFMRLSSNPPKTCTFNLFRLNIEFRLFVFDNESKKDEVQVDTLTIAPAEDVEIKDGKYTGKLTVKLNVEGDNLNDLKAEDLIAKITYRSENQQGANIDFTTNKNDSSDKAVTGRYEHYFEVSNIKVENTLGNTAELSFELNLDGVSLEDFPKDFLVEFYSKGSDENTRPFEYTQTFSFETKENEPAPEPEPEPEPLPAGAYSIKYELNGGTLAEGVTNPRSYTEDSDTIVLNNPDKKGYTFTGWSESDNDAPQNPMSIVHGSKGDKTFIASYTPKNYIITLDPKGGTLKKDSIEYNIETEEFTLPTPTKDSYTFDGWTGSNGDTPERVVKIEKGTTGDKTYTANYSAVAYTITYTLGADDVINDNPTGFNSDTETFTLNEPTRTGYTFTGWTGSNGNTPQKEVTIAKGTTEKKSYTANWSINSYNLTLKHYRGSGVNTVSGDGLHEYNSEVTASCTLAAGFEFDSWFDSEGNKMPDKFKMPAKDLTLSACGKPIVYEITYNLDNGALPQGVTNPTSYDVTSATITLNEPIREGYTFTGWTGSNGNIPEKNLTINKETPEDKSYTANWKLNLTLSIAANENTIIENDLYDCNASFTITPTLSDGITMNDSLKTNILAALCVKDSKNTSLSNLTADWNNEGKIVLTFDTATLTASISYSISFGEIDGVKLTCQPLSFKTFYFKGRGVEDNPYQVASATQLNLVRNYLSCHFEQTDTIDLDGYNWVPIGLNYSNRFTGSYNGNDNKIMNLTISSSEGIQYAGLFGDVGGKIENLILDRFSVTGANNTALDCGSAGVIAGYLDGEIASCTVTDSSGNNQSVIRSARNVGGICGGVNGGSISSCHVENCDIIVDGVGLTGFMYAGGICVSGCTISSCYIRNTNIQVVNADDCFIGGICAILDEGSILSSCYVVNSTVSADNSCSKANVGGIVGQTHCLEDYCNISSCYVANSNVSANNSNLRAYVGGIYGYADNKCNISSCYVANSTVSANNSNSDAYVGGIGGYAENNCNISSCYVSLNSETISGPSGQWGAIVGSLDDWNNAKVTDCFFNKTLSNDEELVADCNGRGVTNCYDGVGDLSTFSSKTWSDGLDYTNQASFNDANSVWKNFDFGNWPPKLDWEQ